MSLPLEPYTVIDLTRARSGPTCVRQLADMGAKVIQISAREDTEGDFVRRGFDSLNLHRHKRSMINTNPMMAHSKSGCMQMPPLM